MSFAYHASELLTDIVFSGQNCLLNFGQETAVTTGTIAVKSNACVLY